MEPELNRAERARELVVETMPEELCLSLPVPVEWNDRYVDAFFTFSISTVGMTPYPTKDCRLVMENGEVIIDAQAFGINAVPFDTSHDRLLENWGEAYQLAYETYESAFHECLARKKGEASASYVRAVKQATQASQLPYYVAMNPWLFGDI